MMTKTAYYMQMAQEAAAQITGSKEQWTAFLTTSARLYKYPEALWGAAEENGIPGEKIAAG